jgi:hypothetical protein
MIQKDEGIPPRIRLHRFSIFAKSYGATGCADDADDSEEQLKMTFEFSLHPCHPRNPRFISL